MYDVLMGRLKTSDLPQACKPEGAKLDDETGSAVDPTVDDTELCVSVVIGNSTPAAKVILNVKKDFP